MATPARWKLNSSVHDLDVTKQTVENAESRARFQIKTSASKLPRGNSRQYAQALHRQADELCERSPDLTPLDFYLSSYAKQLVYENLIETEDQVWKSIQNAFTTISSIVGIFERVRQSLARQSLVRLMEAYILAGGRIFEHLCGEYESALVLYHRAVTLCPHDSSHSVAARRTAVTISSWNNPEKSSTNTRDDAVSRVTSGHKNAALKGHDTSKSFDNLSFIPDVLKYLDSREKTFHKISPDLGPLTSKLIRSRTMLKHVNSRANAMLKSLKANFNAGKMKTSLRLAEDLLTLSSGLGDSHRHRISAYRYLSLIHIALGRHDRACRNVAIMVRLSKRANDVVLLSHALVTLAKVHLSFGHLEAAARALENLSIHVDHPVPRAWMHHEIGRCHLETGKYVKALRKTTQCRECAEEANSKKWTFHAGLLRAQCLAMLGRFAEALEELRIAAKISEEEGDTPMLSYIRDLIGQLNRALREVTFGEDRCLKDILRRLSPRCEKTGLSKGNEAITSSGIRSTTRSKDSDALTPLPSFYSDCLENEILELPEIESNSSSLGSAASCRSKRTNSTYVIESRTDVSCRSKLDGMRICDDELLSRESHMTFRTCYKETRHFIDEEKASLKQSIAACSNNVETSGGQTECQNFRISRSCENGQRDFDSVIDKTRYDAVARISRGRSLLGETEKQDDDEESFVRGAFSSFEVSIGS